MTRRRPSLLRRTFTARAHAAAFLAAMTLLAIYLATHWS